MALLRIPADRLGEFDLVVDLSVRQAKNSIAHEPRAETRLRVPLENVLVLDGPNPGGDVTQDVSETLLNAIVEIVNNTAALLPKEGPSDG